MEAGSVQPAAPAEGAQPGQGAPAESQNNGLYADVLDGIPNEYHESLTERLKGMDAKATQRFQQLSERSKPFEEAGVFDADPEELSSWLNLSGALEDAANGDEKAKEAVQEWVSGLSEQLGFGQEDPSSAEDGDLLDLTPGKLEELVAQQSAKAIEPLMERLDQQEQEKALSEARNELSEQVQKLREANPGLTDDDVDDIYGLAYIHGQDAEDPIAEGFERFKRMVSRGESNLFEQKLGQPAPAEAGGMPNTSAPVPTSENAKDLAMERLKQMQGAN